MSPSFEDLASRPPACPALMCRVCWGLQHLPDKERDLAQAALQSRGAVSNEDVAKRFRAFGFDVKDSAVSRHRNRRCKGEMEKAA